MTTTLLPIVLAAHDIGLCPIPIRSDGSKRPVVAWKQYQQERPTREQVEQWFGVDGHQAAAVVCGAVSGGLVMIEMEGPFYAAGHWQGFRDRCVAELGEDRWRQITGYVEMSPSGGPHLLVRCPEVSIGNVKLAHGLAADGTYVDMMETRGEGGYVIIGGSRGHASGKEWEVARGSISDLATVTAAELDAMLDAARSLDQAPPAPERPAQPLERATAQRQGGGWMDAVVEAYNARHDVLTHLPGWSYVESETWAGETVHRLHREGSDNDHGAVVFQSGRVGFFSANAPHGCEHYSGSGTIPTYDAFTLALLERGGRDVADDRVDFARALRERGYGPPPRTGPVTVPVSIDPETGETTGDDDRPWLLPDEFWTARASLSHIRQAAHSRIRSADLVLHGVLARLSAYTPHNYELPALAGSAGSLNYFALAVGPSGAGKSSGSAIADELLERLSGCEDKPLGSGEGLAENYMGTVTEEDEKGKKVQARRQVRHNVFVYGDEGAALTEMMQRKGATLPEALRRAWTGGALGQSNATTERTRVIPAGAYRLGVLIGFQPEVAAELMADAIAGTPQRFVFAWAADPNIPDAAHLPEWPGRLVIPTPGAADITAHHVQRSGYRRVQLGVSDAIRAEVVADAIQRGRGQAGGEALDSHEPLHLLKLAGMLALLEGRLDIDDDDWGLARILWGTSRAVRAGVVAAVAEHEARQQQARIDFHARREGAAEAARGAAANAVIRVARLIARKAHEDEGEEFTRRALGCFVAGRDRHLLDAALGHADSVGWLVEEPSGLWSVGESRPT